MAHIRHGLILSFEFPPYPGGVGTYSYQMAHWFHNMGIPIVVATRQSGYAYQDVHEFDQGLPFPVFRFSGQKWRATKAIARTYETVHLCRDYNVQWIYCCSLNAAYVAFICKRLLGLPYFLMGHGSEFTRTSFAKKFLLQQAAGHFANSQYTAGLMQANIQTPVKVIPIGADIHEYTPEQASQMNIAQLRQQYELHGSPQLLSIGRLNPRKGHHVTLQALTRIKAKYPQVQLIIVGRNVDSASEYEASLHHYVEEQGLQENVHFIPVASMPELRTLYAMADVFILSSIEYEGDVEGFGIVLIEANLMEKPVVASSSGGIVEAVEDGKSGFLYEASNAQDLADKVMRLLGDPALRSEMGRYGRKRALDSFHWEAVAMRTWQAMIEMYPPAGTIASSARQQPSDK